ncbi:MAG: hypothetical protein ACLSCX_05030, partial [Oscillospiraceae bacterium]
MLLTEQIELTFVLGFEFLRLPYIHTSREFDAARLQFSHRAPTDLLVEPDIAAKSAACTLKLLFAFLACHPSHLLSLFVERRDQDSAVTGALAADFW